MAVTCRAPPAFMHKDMDGALELNATTAWEWDIEYHTAHITASAASLLSGIRGFPTSLYAKEKHRHTYSYPAYSRPSAPDVRPRKHGTQSAVRMPSTVLLEAAGACQAMPSSTAPANTMYRREIRSTCSGD